MDRGEASVRGTTQRNATLCSAAQLENERTVGGREGRASGERNVLLKFHLMPLSSRLGARWSQIFAAADS